MPDLDANIKKRRTPPWILGGVVLILLVLLVLLQSSNLWKTFTVESASDTLALYALSSLNFIAFIVFAFILTRSLLKLRRERRAMQVGSKLKTRLLMYFIGISILPIIAMAVFSSLFLNRAIDRWFSDIPERAARQSQAVQDQANQDMHLRLGDAAKILGSILSDTGISNEKLDHIVKSGNLTRLEVLDKSGRVVAESQKDLDVEQSEMLKVTLNLARTTEADDPALRDGEGFDAVAVNLTNGQRLIVVPNNREQSGGALARLNSLEELDRLKASQRMVRLFGFSTLGLLTFLLIFASSWAAFYTARGLTTPVKALAEGADEIARGNLSHRVDVIAEDELALLVSNFNQMSAKLEENSAELLERRRYTETILQSLSAGVISFDAGNKVSTINKAAIHILRLEDANFEGVGLSSLLSEENRTVIEKLIGRANRTGQASEQTVLQREHVDGNAETGETMPAALTATALPKNEDDQLTGVVVVIEDLTELLTAQRASAWQEVARRMAHEIKNPLTPIQLSAERILRRYEAETGSADGTEDDQDRNGSGRRQSDGRKFSKVINESTETILREVGSLKLMVDEFSQFARLPKVMLEPGDINEIVNQAADLYQDRADDVEFELGLQQDVPGVMLDAEQLRRVLVNLIDNALEAFEKQQTGKQISITTSYNSVRDLVIVEVSDNGAGISGSHLAKLFQPYFSTKGRGTGLGLTIVQRIIIEHGGKIRAASNLPKGAKFVIELPANV